VVLHLGLGRLERAQRLVGHDHVAGHDRQRGDLLGARLGPARRHLGARVPGQDRLGVQHVVHLPHPGQQRCIAHAGLVLPVVFAAIPAAVFWILSTIDEADYRSPNARLSSARMRGQTRNEHDRDRERME
jgi:hypothetical protein